VQTPPKAKMSWIPEVQTNLEQWKHKSRSIPIGINQGTQHLSQEPGTGDKWGNGRRPPTADSRWLEQRLTSNPVEIGNQMHSHGCTFCNADTEAQSASDRVHTKQQHVDVM
jgi:hypothetical protein